MREQDRRARQAKAASPPKTRDRRQGGASQQQPRDSRRAAPSPGASAPRPAARQPVRQTAVRQPSRQPAVRQPSRQRPAPRSTSVVDLQERRHARSREKREPAVKTRRAGFNALGFTLMFTVGILIFLGLVMIYSSSSNLAYLEYGNSFYFLERQAAAALIGVLMMIGLSRRDYHWMTRYARLMMIVGIGLLVMCFIPSLGTIANGSRRFLRFGIQPSEFMKLAIILFLGYNLNRRDLDVRDPFDLAFPTLAMSGLALALILVEPDMGTTVIIACTVLVMLVVGGARWQHLAAIVMVGAAGGVVAIFNSTYRAHRFFAFLNPWGDPQGSGFHIIQSLLAMGSGNLYGMGLGMSRQKFMYLPNAHNDFIFSIIGEEAGFIGTMLVVGLFVTFILVGVKIARRAPDPLGRQLAMGITFLIGSQAFVNMGAVTGILPITGVTLPFISYGGSSLVIFMSLVGILVSVASRERVAEVRKSDEGETDARSDLRGRYRRTSVSSSRAG